MTITVLIQFIVRQTTILIAQLATTGHGRAPLALVAGQVFSDLVLELERQGVSRQVTADMFGLSLRTFQRKMQRMEESSTEEGRSTWEAVLEFIRSRDFATTGQILTHFARDDEAQVRSVLRDLRESRLVLTSGSGSSAVYRASTEEELGTLWRLQGEEGLEELLWALIYRDGPISLEGLIRQAHLDEETVKGALARLAEGGRVERSEEMGETIYRARNLVVPLGSPVGWEAAVFDHFKAMVNTVAAKLRGKPAAPELSDRIGGSTWSLDIWHGHPLEEEAYGTLARIRSMLVDLRSRVDQVNAENVEPENLTRVVVYAGQHIIGEDDHAVAEVD
jgi:hypothetical protein